MSDYHYFGSSVYGWQVADSREQVIKDLARAAGSTILRRHKAGGNGGLLVVTCRVMAPIDASYAISDYVPQGVDIADKQYFRIHTTGGLGLPCDFGLEDN